MIMIHKELATSLFKIRHRCDFTLSHGMTQDQEGYVVHSHLRGTSEEVDPAV